ncbi:MAG: DUF3089 domain-containing protein [Sphingomonas fennica]
MWARRFLYAVAALVVLVLLAAIGWNLFQDRLLRVAFVPSVPFAAPPAAGAPDYARPAAWLARPGLADDPTHYLPAGVTPALRRPAAVFYIPPTTYLGRDRWNAPLDDTQALERLRLFAASQGSVFTAAGDVWAPLYRQATIGAFLSGSASAGQALDFAYGDVARAFDAFLGQVAPDRPILLAGHSQGALHLMRLLKEKVAGRPIARRIVAAYVVGWPISIEADLPALGLPACAGPAQAGCILSWQSFAEPADAHLVTDLFAASRGLTGRPRGGTRVLCTNPLTGTPDTAAPAAANRGSLVAEGGLKAARLVPGRVPARCGADGLLLIGEPPEGYDSYVLPGRNYHVFDYMLFWANVRADAAARTAAFAGR